MRAGLFAATIVVACAAGAYAQYGGIRVQGDGYAYVVPNGWQEQTAEGVERMHGSPTAPGRTINITTEPFVGTASAYMTASLAGLGAQQQVQIRSSRPTMVGSLQGFEIESDWASESVVVHLLQVGTTYNGRGFVLTCGDLAGRFSQAIPECRAIFATFMVGPDVAGRRPPQASQPVFNVAGPNDASGSSVAAVQQRLRAAVDGRGADLTECQAAAQRRGPVSGQVEVEVVVRRDGSVAGVRVVNDSTGAVGLASCVQGVVSSVRVGPPPAADTTVRHTVAFGR